MIKKGFTLVELVVGIIMIGIWLGAIINVLQYGTKLTNSTKSQVVAVNLAREWVETVFSIRDTNWKMFSSKRDECWLSRLPDTWSTTCESLQWIWSGYYSIKSPLRNIQYFTGENILLARTSALQVFDNQWSEAWTDTGYRICFYSSTWNQSGYRDTCSNSPIENRITKYGTFWRWIEVKWLFLKDNVNGWTKLTTCTDGSSPGCGWSAAKELRFCSRVDYDFNIARRVELCSAITNFLQ